MKTVDCDPYFKEGDVNFRGPVGGSANMQEILEVGGVLKTAKVAVALNRSIPIWRVCHLAPY